MDRIDLRIFSRLVSDPFRSDAALGREVGLTGKAVRLRRRRIEAHRVISEYGVHPAAQVLGRHPVTWRYVGEEREDLPIAELSRIEDLAYVMRFRPAFHRVVRFTRDPDAPPDPRLARLLGRPVGGPLGETMPAPAIPAEALSPVDWKVLEAVVADPRAPFATGARRARLSPRTFRVHRAKLDAAGVLQNAMILDLEHEVGIATFGIWLRVDGSFDPSGLDRVPLWDRPHWTRHPRGVYLLGSADNYFEARRLELELRSLPGVVGADPLIPAGGFFNRDRFVGWIRTERERRSRSPTRA